jgi:hypothetical protein
MNDLDDLKDALHSPPGFVARSLDLDAIMTTGGRRRRARRLAVSATSGLAVVAVLIGGGWLAARNDRAAPGLLPPAAASASPSPSPSVPPTDGPATAPLGAVVSTGLKAKQGTWVIYAVPVREPSLPDTHFGIMVGRRMPDGTFTSDVISNETNGSDTAKGFHALQGGMNVNGEDIPSFGYFVGPATRFTAKVGGKTIEAGHARWSKDASVVMFWFDPAKVGAASLTKLTAYGASGTKLPGGKTEFGVG